MRRALKREVSMVLRATAAVAALLLLAIPAGAPAQDLEEAGQKLIDQHGEAIVTVRVVASMGNNPSADQDAILEAPAPVVSANGLTVIPLALIDPSHQLKKLGGAQYAMLMQDIGSRPRDIKIIVGRGGKELDAEIVLRDPDLDIALIRPKQAPAEPMSFIDLANAAQPKLLQRIITLSRMGKIAARQNNVASGEIQAILTRPRTLYVPHGAFVAFGAPVFTVDGKLLGMTLLHTAPGGLNDAANGVVSLSLSHLGILPVILPAEELAEFAAKGAEVKEAEKLQTAADEKGTTATMDTEMPPAGVVPVQ